MYEERIFKLTETIENQKQMIKSFETSHANAMEEIKIHITRNVQGLSTSFERNLETYG